jgi:hypothetical protein
MKTFHKFCAAFFLLSTLSLSAFAGQIEIGYDPTPQPTPAQSQGDISTTANGGIHTGDPGDMHTTEPSAAATLAGAVVDLVQGVLALL